MGEILTAQEVASILRISKRQVYELAKETENPIPSIRIRTSVRFRKVDSEAWLMGLADRTRPRDRDREFVPSSAT